MTRKTPTWMRALIAVGSAGWLLPMWLGCWATLRFVEAELMPALMQQPRLNSFPFTDFALDCFSIAFLWLGAVVAGWAWAASGRITQA